MGRTAAQGRACARHPAGRGGFCLGGVGGHRRGLGRQRGHKTPRVSWEHLGGWGGGWGRGGGRGQLVTPGRQLHARASCPGPRPGCAEQVTVGPGDTVQGR